MGRNPGKEDTKEFLEYLRSGRDQMELLECSISGADKNPDFDTRSLSFARECKHPVTGEVIDRSWLVTFSAEFGRPTPKDDDVFVALMKVSQDAGLMTAPPAGGSVDARVRFSSYQLIKILQWGDDGRSYQAIDDALNRIGGVFIVAKNYRFDETEQEFYDAKFHLIDQVFLYERDKYDRALRRARAEGKARPTSSVWWSDVMLESFQSGNVRRLDLEVYNSFRNPIARKLYRYLGKQFWIQTNGRAKRPTHRIDLKELCHDKLGYRRTETRTSRLKDKVGPAIAELEERGVYGLRHAFNQSYGRCEVEFGATYEKKTRRRDDAHPLVTKLVALRVVRDDAERAVKRHDAERIIEDIEDSGFREKHGGLTGSRAGCLAAMLKSDEPWERPKGFVSSIVRKKREQLAAKRRVAKEDADRKEQERRQQESDAKRAAFDDFFEGLPSDAEREAFADEAVASNKFCRDLMKKNLREGNADQAETYRQLAMQQLFEERRGSSRC